MKKCKLSNISNTGNLLWSTNQCFRAYVHCTHIHVHITYCVASFCIVSVGRLTLDAFWYSFEIYGVLVEMKTIWHSHAVCVLCCVYAQHKTG